MPSRVRDILLVSSDYDAFVLEEDGRLSDRLFVEYSELNLSTMPTLVHVPSAAEALRALKQRRFDLVLTTVRLEDLGVRGLSRRIKGLYPDLPVVLLVLDQVELKRLAQPLPRTIDRVFLWTGDTRILLAIVKVIEDSLNVSHDTTHTGVQVIIMTEDSVRYYSSFLALLYAELMAQSQSLIAEGVNALHKLLRMRARPKILLATSFEEARDYFELYRDHVLALITDVQFPRDGQVDPDAGYRLAREVLSQRPDLPVLVQSANPESAQRAEELKVSHLDKNSPGLLAGLQKFLKENLGFGDFVFRLPDFTEVGRAADMYQLIRLVAQVDERSLYFHASRNHFNVWLRARSMFEVADQLARASVEDFSDVQALRTYLLEVLGAAAELEQGGVVSDFSPHEARWFVRLGHGSIGGKGRGIAFLHYLVARHNLAAPLDTRLRTRIPRTVVLATGLFDRFLRENDLEQAFLWAPQELADRFLQAQLPADVETQLRAALASFRGPLAVRSSSLLEDSQHQSCAGIYETVLLPHRDDDEVRFQRVLQAVRTVYASTYSERAQTYLKNTPFSAEDEKMAVVIQEVVGQTHGTRFYPHVSGVALSWNHYPMEPQRSEDGVVQLALGLGQIIVTGGRSVRFSPGCPGALPHLTSPRDFLPYAQRQFLALDLESGRVSEYELSDAEKDGTLGWVASVYGADDDQFRDNLNQAGPRVVTFSNILRWDAIPLAETTRSLLELLRAGMSSPVEIEFALDLAEDPCLYLLQVRPLAETPLDLTVQLENEDLQGLLCRSPRSIGHGVVKTVRDILYVKSRDLDSRQTAEVARQLPPLNAALRAADRPYLLVGPGRWGSSDSSLGIPIDISQILGAAVIIELPFSGRHVDPSVGSHFFHEIVARRVGYICLPAFGSEESYFDWDWLQAQPLAGGSDLIGHVRLEEALTVLLDGRCGKALVRKPT